MDKYQEYKEKYKNFYYNSYEIKKQDSGILITYDFEIENLSKFNPTVYIPVSKNYDEKILENMVFSLGFCELISYWKLTCSKNIIIKCMKIDEKQKLWLKKLLLNGLGEFFYTNNITVNKENFVTITSSGKDFEIIKSNSNYDGYLVAVGGGKDSITSLEILKDIKNKKAFIMNNRNICFESCYTYGFKDEDIINVKRVFDRKIIDLNNKGFLNGHTPISSCIAFISYISAYLNGIKYIVLSNESSANEASVKGTNINHQYSKSLEFENDFRWYVKNYLDDKIEYFSLLRPLNELEIMKIFTKYPKYFKKFISCNNGGKLKNIGKTDSWCCMCSKCLFIYILMSNFIDQNKLEEIFGENLLNKKEMLNYFLDLLGKTKSKPFECVGTIDEVNYVVNNLAKNMKNPPYLIKYYKENYEIIDINNDILSKLDMNNNVSYDLMKLIKQELYYDRKNN